MRYGCDCNFFVRYVRCDLGDMYAAGASTDVLIEGLHYNIDRSEGATIDHFYTAHSRGILCCLIVNNVSHFQIVNSLCSI